MTFSASLIAQKYKMTRLRPSNHGCARPPRSSSPCGGHSAARQPNILLLQITVYLATGSGDAMFEAELHSFVRLTASLMFSNLICPGGEDGKKKPNEIKSFCFHPTEAEIYRIFHPLVLHRLPAAQTIKKTVTLLYVEYCCLLSPSFAVTSLQSHQEQKIAA